MTATEPVESPSTLGADLRSADSERGRRPSAAFLLLSMLLAADLGFLALHVHTVIDDQTELWVRLVDADRSYAEVFGYLKSGWSALLVVILASVTREWLLLAWVPALALIAVDDALQLHERGGAALADAGVVGPFAGLPPDGTGELVVFAALIAGAAIPLLAVYRLADPAIRRLFRQLLGLLAIVAFFAIGVDALHLMLPNPRHGDALGFVEDGGELLALSLVVAFLFRQLTEAPIAERRSGTRGWAS